MRRRSALTFVFVLAALAAAACDVVAPREALPPAILPTLDSAAFRRAETLIAFFEHGQPVKRFDAVYRHDDGRGYTLGWLGFTTASGSAAEVVRRYAARAPDAPAGAALRALGPTLDRLARDHSGDVSALVGLPDAWRAASGDTAFQRAQDDVARAWYFRAAQTQAVHLAAPGLPPVSALGLAVLYDIVVQHGDGHDADGFSAILQRAGPRGADERAWLTRLNAARRATLEHAHGEATRAAWRESVWRADTWQQLTDGGARLDTPVRITGAWFDVTIP